MTTCPFLRRAEHCMGNVREAPALAYTSVRIKSVPSMPGNLAASGARSGTYLLEVVLMLLVVGHGCVVGVREGKNER